MTSFLILSAAGPGPAAPDEARLEAKLRVLITAAGSEGPAEAALLDPVPVHLLNFTAAVTDAGEVRLLHDLYGRDAAVIVALGARTGPAAEGLGD